MSNLIEEYGSAKDTYLQGEPYRRSYEGTWKDCSQLTLPYIFPVENESKASGDWYPTPYNSIGPSAVNALASKLLLTLLPPTGVFFRLFPDRDLIKDISDEEKKQLDSELSTLEQDVVEQINIQALRVPLFEAIKLLVVTGNVLVYKVPGRGFKVFSPYQYVVQRDYVGEVLSITIKEKMDITTLPENVIKQLEECKPDIVQEKSANPDDNSIEVYTNIVRKDINTYQVWQEIMGEEIEGTAKTFKKDKLPYIPLRWTNVANEDYGRGIVEQYLGDLRSLEGLSQTIVEGAGIMAKTVFGKRPGSQLKIEDLNNAENGEFVLGDLDKEISVLQVNKNADLQVPLNLLQSLEQRISKAFLMLGGQIRDAERVTAVEVRATAAELEATLGGVFSVLANELQKPIITLILDELNPEVLKIAEPSITTGISAISREKDFNNLNILLQSMAQLGPEVLMEYLDISAYLGQVATSLGIEPTTIVKSADQRQQEQEQRMAQQQQMMQYEQQMKGQQ